jgi:cell volume regulation protein A
VKQSDAVVGARIGELGLPELALVMLIVRDGQAIPPRGSTMLEPGDRVYVLARTEARSDVEAVIEDWERRRSRSDAGRRRARRRAGR